MNTVHPGIPASEFAYRDGHRILRLVLEAGNISSQADMDMAFSGFVSAASMTVAHYSGKDTPKQFREAQVATIRRWAKLLEAQADFIDGNNQRLLL